MILAGDIGGTKIRLALFDLEDGKLDRKRVQAFASKDYSGLSEILSSFIREEKGKIDAVCVGAPGPVQDGRVRLTNLDWDLSESELRSQLHNERVRLVNDLVATVAAVPHLTPEQTLQLHKTSQRPPEGATCAVMAPGTGLGQAFLTWHDGKPHPHPSEGGHVDFAPRTGREIELLKFLQTELDHVSYEHIGSGPGLWNIYRFLRNTNVYEEPEALRLRLDVDDPSAVIANAALKQEFEICVQALDIFVSVLGAQAANLAVSLMALGGVYLGGGIPPKIADKLTDGTILRTYLNKGRMTDLVERIPLCAILDDHAALLGAAHLALEL